MDVGFGKDGTARAAVAVLRFPELAICETVVARRKVDFPYVPGLLSFREIPVLMAAFRRLEHKPDLVLCDGQGYAHPRRFGLACHFGVLTDLPTIGVAKTRLIGEHQPVPRSKGSWRQLIDNDEVIGAVLRTRTGVQPVYVSSGHRISMHTAIKYVLACCTKYRLPETTRAAHKLASG
jgi:deoxyribonuclease V